MPGLGVPLAPFEGMGAAGVVFIVDSSWEALEGNYLPFDHGHEPLPALYSTLQDVDAKPTPTTEAGVAAALRSAAEALAAAR